MRRFAVVFLMALLVGVAKAQEGKSAFDFLDLPVSSHANSLGGNNISIIEEDVSMVRYNPALLGPEMDMIIDLNYMRYMAETNSLGAMFAKAAGDRAAWSVGIQYVGYGNLTEADASGNILGKFSAKDMVISGGYTHDFGARWRGGFQTKLIYSAYAEYSSLALAVDLGLNYFNPEKAFSMSLVFKNLGGQLKRFTEKHERLPWDIQLGFSKTMRGVPIRWSVTADHLTKWSLPYTKPRTDEFSEGEVFETKDSFFSNLFRHMIFGIEYVPSRNFYVALGYNYKTYSDMLRYGRNFFSGFTFGAGVQVKMVGLGVSVANRHVKGTMFMFNLNMRLNEFKR
ncbi:MAG: type IX secretion system protein PorQ [Muribaculaceae bacterium]|nr:type IX secretion system protein PorQ [Muribaculaceae bacterium]